MKTLGCALLIFIIMGLSGCVAPPPPAAGGETLETMSPCQEALIDLNFALPYAGGESLRRIR
jgi:hypothetical protein